MARVAFVLPMEDMQEPAQEMALRYHLDVMGIYVVHSFGQISTILGEIKQSGADIVIARAGQASFIKQNADMAVVEIQLSGLDLYTLLQQAQEMAKKPRPRVGLIGFRNIIGAIPPADRLPAAELFTYMLDDPNDYENVQEAWKKLVWQAMQDGIDVLIGGEGPCAIARQYGLPALYAFSGPGSLAEACHIARHVADGIDQEKRTAAELQLVLDHTLDALIQVDAEGVVLSLNQAAEQLLPRAPAHPRGTRLCDLLPDLEPQTLADVLAQNQEIYALPLKIDNARYLTAISPVSIDDRTVGAILSITGQRQIELYTSEQRKALIRQGYNAPYTFDNIVARSRQAQALLVQAKRYARFQLPVLILGEFGTEKEELAQCIHNAGLHAEGPFIHVNCDGPDPDKITQRLFGPDGLLENDRGTIFLNEVSCLSAEGQHLLHRFIMGRADSSYGSLEYRRTDTLRVIAADSHDLAHLVEAGVLRQDLYYALSALTLQLAPLRLRAQDIQGWAESMLHALQERHGRYIHLTNDAWRKLLAYSWPGNLAQLRNFCERVLADAPRRVVDAAFVDALLAGYKTVSDRADDEVGSFGDPYATRISKLLAAHHGNRKAVAAELGISVTTLWRHMRKYNILA